MENDDFLVAFSEYLDARGAVRTRRPEIVSVVKEFAAAIDPVPLAEATVKEMRAFENKHRQRPNHKQVRPRTLRHAVNLSKLLGPAVRARHSGPSVQPSSTPYHMAMAYLREFRDHMSKRRRIEIVFTERAKEPLSKIEIVYKRPKEPRK